MNRDKGRQRRQLGDEERKIERGNATEQWEMPHLIAAEIIFPCMS
jgi:hypothetical protein